MDEYAVEWLAEPDLENPVLVEGLPGVGHVGKLAAEHLLEELESEPVVRIHSEHFPPQVTVEDGRTSLVGASFHAVRPEDGTDMLVLTGDHQAQDNRGHYGLTETFLDVAEEASVETVYALGGVPTGELIEEYDVVGATNAEELHDELGAGDVEFRENEPAGGIVGVSGLLLGLGERRDVPAACLMGETSGYLVDPKSARAVLEVLADLVGFEVGYESLKERAEEMEEVVRTIQEMEGEAAAPADEDLRYIG
jgi:uncharacterized protein (TIGR00162 family)